MVTDESYPNSPLSSPNRKLDLYNDLQCARKNTSVDMCVTMTNQTFGALNLYIGPILCSEVTPITSDFSEGIFLMFSLFLLLPPLALWNYLRSRRRAYCACFWKVVKNRDGYITKEQFVCLAQDELGLKWKEIGSEEPLTGTEIKNELLSVTLQKKMKSRWQRFQRVLSDSDAFEFKFRKDEWAKFEVANLSSDSYIKAGDLYFTPFSNFPFKTFPFHWLDKNNDGKLSKKEYEAGFKLFEAFHDFKIWGICRPLCLLLRAKYLDEKNKPKAELVMGSSFGDESIAELQPRPLPVYPSMTPAKLLDPSTTPKCDPRTLLKTGCSTMAGQGLKLAVGLDDKMLANMLKEPDIAIECELLVAGLGGHEDGCLDDIDNFYSIKYGKSRDWEETELKLDDIDGEPKAPIPEHVKKSLDTGEYHGGKFKKDEYDQLLSDDPKAQILNKGKKLKDFHEHRISVLACLLIYEVLVLRLYTSTTYKLFNSPLRILVGTGVKLQHPLRFTIYALTEGIKKLRAVEANDDPDGFNCPKDLWRGMKNLTVDQQFLSQGGTEMAVMSTTSEKNIALSYAQSDNPFIFKFKTVGLSRGVNIQFLSLYPKEVEYIYPVIFFKQVCDVAYCVRLFR
jgi:hypothetical protein